MKFLLAFLTVAISFSTLASTYDDREAAISARRHQNDISQTQNLYVRLNRNYLRRMAVFAAKHRGFKTAVSCKSLEAEYNSEHDSTSTTVIGISALSVTVEYTNRDLVSLEQVSHEPQITDCNLELRDGLACKTWTRDAVHHDEVGWEGVMADCVTTSLKESRVDLGSIL